MEIYLSITRGHTVALVKILTLGLLLGFGIQFLFAWTAPSGAAPTNNVAGPLTTSLVAQYKQGSLGVKINYSPTAALEVGGDVAITGNILSTGGTNPWAIRTLNMQSYLALTPIDNTVNPAVLDTANQIKFNRDGTMVIPSLSGCASVAGNASGKLECGTGDATSVTFGGVGSNPMLPLINFVTLAYGEGFSTINGAGNGFAKLYKHDALTPGKKYAFMILTSGTTNDSVRTLANAGLGVDNGRNVRVKCGDGSSWSEAGTYSFVDMNKLTINTSRIAYQGTIIYNPNVNYNGTVHASWGWIPYNKSYPQTINLDYKLIWGAPTGCRDGRGIYVIYIFEPEVLKTMMDAMYAITGTKWYKYNDPLSADPSLHNGDVWTY